MRTQVLAALEESLAATPEPADVWSAVQTGVERRRRRNRYYRNGFAITAIVLVLIVSLAAAGALPPDRAPAGIRVGEWKNTVRPTWLPDGMNAQEFSATTIGERISYWSRDSSLSISVDGIDRSRPLQAANWLRTEVNGRPAWEWGDATHTILVFELPSGRWANVDLTGTRPDVSNFQPAVREEAARVARSLRDDGDVRLRTRFAPTYLPTGQRIIGLETNIFNPAGFGTIVCAAGSLALTDVTRLNPVDQHAVYYRRLDQGPGVRISMTNVAVNTDLDRTRRIADIQGRPAYRAVSDGAVFVAGFRGATLVVEATLDGASFYPNEPLPAGLPPLTELIKIAEGVRWVG